MVTIRPADSQPIFLALESRQVIVSHVVDEITPAATGQTKNQIRTPMKDEITIATNSSTTHEKMASIRAYIADMARLANESDSERAARIEFFGEDCDRIAVIARYASKIIEIANR